MHDHGPAISPDASSPAAEACPFVLVNLPCGCQDVRYACGYVDREHDHVDCSGEPHAESEVVGAVRQAFREWAAEQKAGETPAQAELRRRFEVAFRAEADQED